MDFFRGVPLLLVIFAIGFGVPALTCRSSPTSRCAVYGVDRAGAVLLGLRLRGVPGRAELGPPQPGGGGALARPVAMAAMRYVILPQAVRNIIPPLLNDFISLQKDTALVGVLGAIEANNAAQIYGEHRVQLLQLHRGGHLVPAPHHPARPVHRPPHRARPPAPPGRGHDMSEQNGGAEDPRPMAARGDQDRGAAQVVRRRTRCSRASTCPSPPTRWSA